MSGAVTTVDNISSARDPILVKFAPVFKGQGKPKNVKIKLNFDQTIKPNILEEKKKLKISRKNYLS